MSDEILTIVQAEERAEEIVERAKRESELTVEQARKEREERLQSLHGPDPRQVTAKTAKPDCAALKKKARTNRKRAMTVLMEAIYAAA